MEHHTHSPEKSGRLYFNESFEDTPASGPASLRVVRPLYLRQAALMDATDTLLLRIDNALDAAREGSATPPEELPPAQEREEESPWPELPRRQLGRSALSQS